MQSDAVVTTVRGERIRVADVIVHLKMRGTFRSAIYELIEHRVVEQAATAFGVSVTAQAVEQLAQARRHEHGAVDDRSFAEYLRFHGVSREQWMRSIRLEALREALKWHVATPRRLTELFRRHPGRFQSVSLARVVCRNRAEAERVFAEASNGTQEFIVLARDHSVDEASRLSGGYFGNVTRGILPPEVEERAFVAKADEVIGPFREAGGLWSVYKVYAVNTPKLNDALKAMLADQIFQEWLREQVCTVPA